MEYRAILTDYVNQLIKDSNYDIRLTKQFIIDNESEYNDNFNDIADIANDNDINFIKGLYHRYPSKVLIFPTQHCLGSCRFCFRKNIITEQVISDSEFDKIVDYINAHKEITEVIFSGGDPFAIDEKKLIYMINRIKSLDNIKITRIHTRVLTYEPNLITESFVDSIKIGKPTFMVFHINSHLEITDLAIKKVQLLTDNGILCFSQTALLKDINDSYEDLVLLLTKLIEIKIKPYYLFHPDRVKGTGHFYIPLEAGKKLYNSLFNYISGLAMPTYLFNIPNGYGHCIVDLDNIKHSGNKYQITSWDGNKIIYTE